MSRAGSIFIILGILVAATGAGARDDAPMMAKPSGDITEAGHVDRGVCAPDGLAVGGYDLVSYHQETGPLQGEAGLSTERDGLRYLFVSEANRDAFSKDPQRYLPRYGGWCAVTLALGQLTCPDYTNFQIEDGELLLFETTGFTNGRVLWNTDAAGYRSKADDNYRQLLEAE